MSVERCSNRFLALGLASALALSSFALTACSTSTAAPAAQAVAPLAAASVTTAPLVSGLPDFTALVERYGPAVVNVQVTEKARPRQMTPYDLFGGSPDPRRRGNQEEEPTGVGSGFIVTADGYILTNRHVVADATEVTVRLIDRREYVAKVIGMDENTDVAVIKIEGHDLPTVRIGDPSLLKPGQWVVAIGSPFGMQNSVTAGIVSATTRALEGDPLVPFIQTDVAVNPGNSGGPLFNLNGEVVGINSQIFSQSGGYMGLSFAIPIDLADNVRQQLVSTGKVTRGFLGVSYEGVTASKADSFGLDRPRGALVKEVTLGAPAETAGIKPGDIILTVGGKVVDSEVSLPAIMAPIKPGTRTELEVWTDRKMRKVMVTVGENKPEIVKTATGPGGRKGGERLGKAEPDVSKVLGLAVRPLTAQEKEQTGTAGSLVVQEVTGNSARKSGIQPGDIILGVQGTPVTSVEELKTATGKGDSNWVSLRMQRGKDVDYIEVRRNE